MRGAAILLVLGACRFDPAGLPHDAEPGAFDAGFDAAPGGPDAALCSAVTARITVDGIAHASTTTPAEAVLVGDTVALSSAGSCGPSALQYEWQVSPVDGIRDTILPDDQAGAITVYATLPDAYSVTLTVRSDGEIDVATVYAFDAVGFAPIAGVPAKVRDLDVGDDQLWIATETGGLRAPLGMLTPLTSINGEAIGLGANALPTKLAAILWDDARQLAWIGAFDPAAGPWRIDYAGVPASVQVPFVAVLGGTSKVSDLALVTQPAVGTLAASTDDGAAFSPDGVTFATAFLPPSGPISATAEADETWALGEALHGLDTARDFPIFASGKPSGLAADLSGGGVWLGNEMLGVAHVVPVGAGIQIAPFDDTTGLPSRNARAIAVERDGRFAGDVWVATQKGLARWKLDRETWVTYGNLQGLTGFNDLRAVAIHAPSGAGRAVFAGGNAGAVYAAVP